MKKEVEGAKYVSKPMGKGNFVVLSNFLMKAPKRHFQCKNRKKRFFSKSRGRGKKCRGKCPHP